MLGSKYNPGFMVAMGGVNNGSGISSTFNSVYSYTGPTGVGLAFRFVARAATSISKVNLFVGSITGTPGNLTVEIRNAASATKPGSTLLASTTVAPGAAATKWIQASGFGAHTFTVGEVYFVCVGDAGWTTGNTAALRRSGVVSGNNSLSYQLLQPFTTTNGFNTQTTQTAVPLVVVNFADGTALGCPYTRGTNWGSVSTERGLYINALPEDINVAGVTWDQAATQVTGVKIYEGSTAPGGTTLLTVTLGTYVTAVGGLLFPTVQRLKKGRAYRITLTYGGNDANPGYYEIEDYSTYQTQLLQCAAGNGALYATLDNGAGGWTNYVERLMQTCLILDDAPPIARAGAMRGGFVN